MMRPPTKPRDGKAGKGARWQFMSRFNIKRGSDTYMERLRVIQTPLFGIYLHKFLRPDYDQFAHDHPWTFLSIVLRGGYTEMRRDKYTGELVPRKVGGWRRFNLMRRDDAHFISELSRTPTWSLVFVGRRKRSWGFYVPDGALTDRKPLIHVWVEFDQWEKFCLWYGIGANVWPDDGDPTPPACIAMDGCTAEVHYAYCPESTPFTYYGKNLW